MKKYVLVILLSAICLWSQDSLNTQSEKISDVFRALEIADSIRIADSVYKAQLVEQIASLRDYERSKRKDLEDRLLEHQRSDSLKIARSKLFVDSLKSIVKGFPVYPFGDTLFFVYNKRGMFTPFERAEEFTRRIEELENYFDPEIEKLIVVASENSTDIYHKDKIIISISEMDALWDNTPPNELANEYINKINNTITDYRSRTGWLNLLKQIFLAVLVIFVQYWLIKFIHRYFTKLDKFIFTQKDKRIHSISLKNYEVLSSETLVKFVQLFAKGVKYFVIAFMLYITLPILFSIFPVTENIAESLFGYVLNPVSKIYYGIIDYIPNLFTIIVVFVVTNYSIRIIKYFAAEIENGKLNIKGFYPDWAKPTFNIIRFLLYAFMFIIIFPYLPGSESAVFQGVSVFIGIIFSLGSSSAISNMVAGLVITYMRSFKLGDRIKINEIIGNVIEKTPIVTRVKTVKNEIITIPNSTILTSNITNYTSSTEETGLILHTTITIGYDVPWRQVHELMYAAADSTTYILKNPQPFILQTSLDDFYVSYQLNAYTKEANLQSGIYSELHQNIQDKFNEAGVEIMSPHYRAERDGNSIAIPESYKKK